MSIRTVRRIKEARNCVLVPTSSEEQFKIMDEID